MARAENEQCDILDALGQGQVEQARYLLSNGCPFDLGKAVEIVVERGQCEALKFLVRKYNIDVNKNVLLHRALFFQHENMVRLLVELGADVNQCQMTNISNSMRRAVRQREDIGDCSVENIKFFLPLQLSLRCGVELMSFLLHSGTNVNEQNGLWETTLMSACAESVDVQRVELLLQHGAQTNLKNLKTETALHLAAETGNIGKVQLLIDHGADIEAATNTQTTALLYACDRSVDVDCLALLLQNGANPNSQNYKGETVLHLLSELGETDRLHVCVQHNANVNARDYTDQTPLMVACANDSADVGCVRFLLQNNALPNKTDKHGQSALHISADKGNLEKLRVLVQYNANVNATDYSDQTPLIMACRSNTADVECVKFLLQHNALFNVTSTLSKQSALYIAADQGSLEKLQLLIHYTANINTVDCNNTTLLMAACASDTADVTCVRFLLENNALPNMTGRRGQSALHRAAVKGNLEKLQVLVQYEADVNARDMSDETPLMAACASDIADVTCVRFLLENNALPNIKDKRSQSALHVVTEKGNMGKLQVLVQYKADVNIRDGIDNTPLMAACASDIADVACVRFLLENNALPNVTNRDNQTALHIAASKGNLEKLQVLVHYNADVNAKGYDDQTPLMVACASDTADVACVRFLLQSNALPNIISDRRNQTALHIAAGKGNLEKLQVLVQYNADVNARRHDDQTPLMVACASDTADVACVRFLLQNKALPNVTTWDGQSAIHIAYLKGKMEKLRVLVENNADVNIRDGLGKTPLMLACEDKSVDVECVNFLLANNALPDLHDMLSDTALDRAVMRGHLELLKSLLQWGTNVNVRPSRERQPEIYTFVGNLRKNLILTSAPIVRGDTHLHSLIRTEAILRVIHAHKQYNVSLTEGGSVSILSRALAGIGKFYNNRQFMSSFESSRKAVGTSTIEEFDEDDLFCLPLGCKSGSIRTSITSKLKLFLKSRADIELSTDDGETAYVLAARALDRLHIELLYSHGANIFAVDSDGRNAIMLALISTQYWMMLDEKAVEGLECLQCLVHQGVPINHRDKAGRTPLMIAAYYENVDILRLLLSAGADVHAVRTERIGTAPLIEITALSNLLENPTLDIGKNMACIKELIRRGAANSLPVRFNNLLHDLIEDDIDKREMIALLLSNGMAPTMSGSPPTNNSALSLSGPYRSPLMVALHDGFVPVIKYLLENLMLCPCDISGHSYHELWREELISQRRFDVVDIMDNFYSEPLSLEKLSLVHVSYALGGVPGRIERVKSLGLSPLDLEPNLLFKYKTIPMDLT